MSVWFGGDYNPDQWPEDVWDEDVTLMRRANVNLATVGVFSWARLEPREGEFDFAWLDDVLDRLHQGGIRVDLATATASPPPWLSLAYPETLPETREGVRLWPGSRQQYCPSSPIFRRLAARLVTQLSERYGDHPALEMWHINNEYGCHVSHCYCDVSAAAFRVWLTARYGTIDQLNAAWGTAFWSQKYGDFDEITPPRAMPSFPNPTQLLDFDRFSSDELLECYRVEKAILRAATPDVPITTNFMGFFKPADYWAWAREVDVVSDDSYPDPADPHSPAYGAMTRDLMRSLRQGQPWILMEQSSSAVNWRSRNAPKLPGQMRAWSYQCIARGADGILYFQWRQSVAGAEKFHAGLLPHMGTDTRVWREVEQLGAELTTLDELVGSRLTARMAIVVDWDSWRALEQQAMPANLSYLGTLFAWYETLYELGILVDFVAPTGDLENYAVVLVPTLQVTNAAALANLTSFADNGGHLVVTYQSAILDENLRVLEGGYLGSLASTLGVRVEEFAPPAAPDLARSNQSPPPPVRMSGASFGETEGTEWAEFLTASTADVRATFTDGALAGSPAITENKAGAGTAWYVATLPSPEARSQLLGEILSSAGVAGALEQPLPGVE
ncbi:MAG: beta-galactosidase, partial [Actinomycetota bacterium]|nr:beta-galactosidase [Actinomycetota bacterium]